LLCGLTVGTRELLPCLNGEAGERSLPHAIVDELPPGLGCLSFCGEDSDDFFVFGDDIGVLEVAAGLDVSEDVDCFFGSVDHG
jgi:hypothetical protein